MARAWHQNFKRARKVERTDKDGTVFDSKGELTRWKKLQLWQLAGQIRNLRRQVAYPLTIHRNNEPQGGISRPILTPSGKTAEYRADFVYERWQERPEEPGFGDWIEVIEDFKGYQSRENQFRIAVFEAIYGKKVTISTKKGTKSWG